LQTQFIVFYKVLTKIIFENKLIFKNISSKIFCFDQLRSTGSFTSQNGRPCGRPQFWPLGACMCAIYPVDRVVDRTPCRATGRSTDWLHPTLCLGWSTGRSTGACQRSKVFEKRSTGRSTL